MANATFAAKLVNVERLGRRDIDDIRKAAGEFWKLYNVQAYDEIHGQIRKGKNLTVAERADLYIELCNKWGCRIRGSVREEALKPTIKAERLAGKIDKSLEQIERPDHALIIKPGRNSLVPRSCGSRMRSPSPREGFSHPAT